MGYIYQEPVVCVRFGPKSTLNTCWTIYKIYLQNVNSKTRIWLKMLIGNLERKKAVAREWTRWEQWEQEREVTEQDSERVARGEHGLTWNGPWGCAVGQAQWQDRVKFLGVKRRNPGESRWAGGQAGEQREYGTFGLCTDCSVGSDQNQCWGESTAGGESNGAADGEATLDTELTSMKLNTRRPSYQWW